MVDLKRQASLPCRNIVPCLGRAQHQLLEASCGGGRRDDDGNFGSFLSRLTILGVRPRSIREGSASFSSCAVVLGGLDPAV